MGTREVCALLAHVGGKRDKGELLLLLSEIAELQRIYPHISLSISGLYTQELERLNIEYSLGSKIVSPLLDVPTVAAESRMGRKLRRQGGTLYTSAEYGMLVVANSLAMVLRTIVLSLSLAFQGIFSGPIYRKETWAALKHADIILITGGENFGEGPTYSRSVYDRFHQLLVLFPRMIELLIARRVLRKRIVILPQSVGEFRSLPGKMIGSMMLNNVDLIFLREPLSARVLSELRVRTPFTILSDMALLFRREDESKAKKLPSRSVVVCPCLPYVPCSSALFQRYTHAHAVALDNLVEKFDVRVFFLPSSLSELWQDRALCQSIKSAMKSGERALVLEPESVQEFAEVVSNASLLLSTRFHPVVLACATAVPFLAISYGHKQGGLLQQLGLRHLEVKVYDVSPDVLMSALEHAWICRKVLRKHLAEVVPILQDRLHRTLHRELIQIVKC